MAKHESDGHLAAITDADLVKGNVLRTVEPDGGQHSFSDTLVLDVFFRDTHGVRLSEHQMAAFGKHSRKCVILARPYAFVSGAGTCCPSVLTGVEQFEVEATRLLDFKRYKLVVQSTGLAANHTT